MLIQSVTKARALQSVGVFARTSRRGIGSVSRVGVRGAKSVATGLSGCPRSVALIAAVFAALTAVPQLANAACSITRVGTVSCNTNTATTKTANIDGRKPSSSARTQRFHNGSAINGTIQPGVTVEGFGLHLVEKPGAKRIEEPITLNNQGQVATSNAVNALQLTGDGGSISYSGGGSVTDTDKTKAGLSVHNRDGDASVITGAGAISGATGIQTSTTGHGALTLTTGSGLVNGTAGDGILANTGNGALTVTVGSGGVTSYGDKPAIDLTSQNGSISITANNNVSANGQPKKGKNDIHGIEATSNGRGNIIVGGSGTIFAQAGRGIFARQSLTGLGGILVTGTGDTISGTTKLGCCSAIRAKIADRQELEQRDCEPLGERIYDLDPNTSSDGRHSCFDGWHR